MSYVLSKYVNIYFAENRYVLRADRVSELLGCNNTDFVRARALLRERRELSQQRTLGTSSTTGGALDSAGFSTELPSDSTTSSSPVASSSFALGIGFGTSPPFTGAQRLGAHVVPYPALSEERAEEADRLSSDQIRSTLRYMGMHVPMYTT